MAQYRIKCDCLFVRINIAKCRAFEKEGAIDADCPKNTFKFHISAFCWAVPITQLKERDAKLEIKKKFDEISELAEVAYP